MLKRVILLCVLVSLYTPVQAMDSTAGWNIAANGAIVLDCLQTRDIANNPDQFSEQGWAKRWIGEHPTSGEVTEHCLKSLLVMNATGWLLPEEWNIFGWKTKPKEWFYIGVTTLQADTVIHNYQAGVSITLD